MYCIINTFLLILWKIQKGDANKMEKHLQDDFDADFENGDIQTVANIYHGFFEKKSEKIKRETYKKVFGCEFDAPTRKHPPLPLDVAFRVALQRIAQDN